MVDGNSYIEKTKIAISENMTTQARNIVSFIFDRFLNSNEKIEIPFYQRKYVWGKKEFSIFLEDIKNIKKNEIHYIGNIIIKENKIHKIVDGQQRLSSIFILLKAITLFIANHTKKNYNNKNKELFFYLNVLFNLKNKTEPLISKKFKRTRNNADDNLFEYLWQNDFYKVISKKEKKNSNNVGNNFKIALEFLIHNFSADDNFEKFNKFIENLFFNTYFVEISKLEKIDDLKLFEKMNTLGIRLNALELIKNKIASSYSEAVNNDQDNFEQKFNNKIEKLFYENREDKNAIQLLEKYIANFATLDKNQKTSFEKYWYYIESEFIEKINEDKGEKAKLDKLIELMNRDIELFLDIYLPEKHFDSKNRLYFISDYLTTLVSPKKNIYIALIKDILISFGIYKEEIVLEKWNKIREILSILENYEFRNTIANVEGQSIRPIINRIRKIWKDKTKDKQTYNLISKEEFYKIIKEEFEDTQQKFVDWSIVAEKLPNKDISQEFAKELLTRIEVYAKLEWSNTVGSNSTILFPKHDNKTKITAEHIVPQKLNKIWDNEIKNDEQKRRIIASSKKIGNYLLLIKSSNSGAQNNTLNLKWNYYLEDKFLSNQSVIYAPNTDDLKSILEKIVEKKGEKLDQSEKEKLQESLNYLELKKYIENGIKPQNKEKIKKEGKKTIDETWIEQRSKIIGLILEIIFDNLPEKKD